MSEETKEIQGKLSLKQDVIIEISIDDMPYRFHMPVNGSWSHALNSAKEIVKEVESQYARVVKDQDAKAKEDNKNEKEDK
jgi:hypothetical protein